MGERAAEAGLARGTAWLVAALSTLAMSVSYIDRQVLAALAQSVKQDLGLDVAAFGWIAGAFSISYLVGTPLAGVLIDRIGARRGLVASMLVWSLVAAAHAGASSFAMLFALRVALGAAESPSFPAAAQSVRRALPLRDRAAAFGLLFTGSSIGAMIAPPLAIAMKLRFGGWRPAFFVSAMIGLAWVPAWLLATRGADARRALSRRPVDEAPRVSIVALLREPGVARAVLLVCGSAPSVMFVWGWLPQYLEHAHHVAENDVARYAFVPPVFFDAGAVLFGAIATARDRRANDGVVRSHVDLTFAAAVLCATMALVPLAPSASSATAIFAASLVGGGALYARLTADMLARVAPSHASTAAGLTAAAQSLVHIVGNPVVGRVVRATGSFDAVLVAVGSIAIPFAIVWSLVRVAPVVPGASLAAGAPRR